MFPFAFQIVILPVTFYGFPAIVIVAHVRRGLL